MLRQIHKKISFLKSNSLNISMNQEKQTIQNKFLKQFWKNSFFNFSTSTKYKTNKIEYSFQTIFEILKLCDLEPNYQSENTLRTKYCPVCDKPHNEEPTNLNTLVIYKTNSIYYCYRCGNRGHFQRLFKILNKKFDLSNYKDLMISTGYSSNGSTTGTENEDFFPSQPEFLGDNHNEKRFKSPNSEVNSHQNSNEGYNPNNNQNSQLNSGTYNSLNSLNISNKETYKIFLNNTALLNELYKRNILLENEKCGIILDYLVNDRKLTLETLRFYNVGVSYEKFKSNSFEYINLPCVTYPMFYYVDKSSYLSIDKNCVDEAIYNHFKCDKYYLSRLKVRAIGKEFKHFQRIEPAGSILWGLFGLDTVPDNAEELIVTEGEYDAMAAYQALKIPSVSLPNGASSLPLQLLPYFSRFKRIYLWMDADQAGQIASDNFSKKIGEGKTMIINTRRIDPNGPKDANDALKLGKDFTEYIRQAKPLSGDNLIKMGDIRGEVIQFLSQYERYSGYKSTSFSFINKKLKGLRMGEFSILTGETGSGKTTFLTQLSLDFLKQGVPTLWGSFEIKNDKLASLFLLQYSKKNLRKCPIEEIEFQSENFEKLPLYMLKFHGSQNIDDVVNTMSFAVFNHDIQHIVLDNLQFMVGIPTKISNKFDYQDEIIQRLRKFATEKNVHITLVIHPRKDEILRISSIFGTGKASQEADNIYILQSYKGLRIVEIAKNRFDGVVGKVAMAFDNDSCRFFELTIDEFSRIVNENFKLEDVIKERIVKYGSVEPELEVLHGGNVTTDEVSHSKKYEENLIYENAINIKEREMMKMDPRNMKREDKNIGNEIMNGGGFKNSNNFNNRKNMNNPSNYQRNENINEVIIKEDEIDAGLYMREEIIKENLENSGFEQIFKDESSLVKNIDNSKIVLRNNLNSTKVIEKIEENLIHVDKTKSEIFHDIGQFQQNIFPEIKAIDTFHTSDSLEKTQTNSQKQNFSNFKNKNFNQKSNNFNSRTNNFNTNKGFMKKDDKFKRDDKVKQSTYKINNVNSFMDDVL